MDNFQEESQFYGKKVFLSWIRTDRIEKYHPITQVYGIIFNEKGKILIARETKELDWIIPGGRPHKDESIEEALKREMMEEVDVGVKNLIPLGVQKVYFPDNPNKKDGELFYQARLVGMLDQLLPQTRDPDSGNVWERRFTFPHDVSNYVKWGKTGESMFKDAERLYTKIRSR